MGTLTPTTELIAFTACPVKWSIHPLDEFSFIITTVFTDVAIRTPRG